VNAINTTLNKVIKLQHIKLFPLLPGINKLNKNVNKIMTQLNKTKKRTTQKTTRRRKQKGGYNWQSLSASKSSSPMNSSSNNSSSNNSSSNNSSSKNSRSKSKSSRSKRHH
jgi:hypothetical protein